MSYKQLKLISGEEIICEVVYYPDNDNEDNVMVIRSAIELAMHEDLEEAIRFYTFKPYMMYVYDEEQLITLNANNITSMTTPHDEMLRQYKNHFNRLVKEDDEIFYEKDSDELNNILKFRPKLH